MIKISGYRAHVEVLSPQLIFVEIESSQNEAKLLAIQQFLKSLEPGDQRVQDHCDEYIDWLEAWLHG